MALFGALSTSRSGLINTGAALSVIGNNIANVGTAAGGISDVSVAGLQSQARATVNANLRGNLQADAALKTFDGTSFQTAINTSDYFTSVRVFDSLGKAHDMSLFFSRTGTNAWS